jgi:hypothetical protein
MRNARSAIVFLVVLTLGLSLAVVAENLPETAFDESETQPYESTPLLFSIVVRPVAARAAADGLTRVSPLRSAPVTGRRGCHLQYERLLAHPDSNSLTILDCSLRC